MGNNSESIDAQRRNIPDEPGVYLYHDHAGKVLYIGKAKSLRKRVNSYFTGSHNGKTHALVMRIRNIEVLVLGSEKEALVVEARLIRLHKPPFNVMLCDDKSYPFIAITKSDDFPRVMFTRERHRKDTLYFGPYTGARRVRELLDLLNRVFQYRPCEGPVPGRQSGVPCLDYHIERCSAPCIGAVDKEQYSQIINEVKLVLSGKTDTTMNRLVDEMAGASQALEFERAARLRNRIRDLERIIELQEAETGTFGSSGDYDVLAAATMARDENGKGYSGKTDKGFAPANVQVLHVRNGKLGDRSSHFLEYPEGLDASSVLAQFILSWYEPGRAVPPLVVVPRDALNDVDHEMVGEELERIRGSRVEVRAAERGEKRRLAELAERNAAHALRYDSLRERQKIEQRALALEELRDALGLENLPVRIECYDISNLQDEAPAASMVVFEDSRPNKDHYRKFSMRHSEGQNDFAMMAEAISRRFTRLAEGDEDESFGQTPQLVVIDGGKGQLSAAMAAFEDIGVTRVAFCSLAKREEEVFLPGRRDPILLPRDSSGLKLLQRIRDEAHRFALRHHRSVRDAKIRVSFLDQLKGVGEARKRALLNFFGSPEAVRNATLDELEAVPGLPRSVAGSIYEEIHRVGRRAR